MTNKIDNSNVSTHLGKSSQYKSQYDPTILVREPRSSNREYLSIKDDDLPFVGFDTWNAYECSFLLESGLPVAGLIKIVYPCDNKYIVESKSLKLYLMSFNMTKLGNKRGEAINIFEDMVADDLSALLETDVRVSWFDPATLENDKCRNPLFSTFKSLDYLDVNITHYNETPEILTNTDYYSVSRKLAVCSNKLHSRCRVTGQPDTGSVYIFMEKKEIHLPTEETLLEYITSFRNECHFHEEICECIYKRLQDIYNPKQLMVCCLYNRRGGIDIDPIRTSSVDALIQYGSDLIDSTILHTKTARQ